MSSDPKNKKIFVDEAEWPWLKPHFLRGAVVLVSDKLDLLQVADRVVADDKTLMKKWLDQLWVTLPSEAQIREWEASPGKTFLFVIVQPYVLIQPKPTQFH